MLSGWSGLSFKETAAPDRHEIIHGCQFGGTDTCRIGSGAKIRFGRNGGQVTRRCRCANTSGSAVSGQAVGQADARAEASGDDAEAQHALLTAIGKDLDELAARLQTELSDDAVRNAELAELASALQAEITASMAGGGGPA